MCLIVFAWRPDTDCPLLLAANRDEFHARATAPMQFWDDAPQVLAGRDLEAGGTWLGITRAGRFAAVTNVRDPASQAARAPRSRGDLTREFLSGMASPGDYLSAVAARRNDYLGFNLLVGDGEELWYLHGSDGDPPRPLTPGIYGLSNAALDVPWPKVERARGALLRMIEAGASSSTLQPTRLPTLEELRDCVSDRTLADDEALHGARLEGEMARRLSAQFIVTPQYGTRCCTTVRWHPRKSLQAAEQRFDAAGQLTGHDRFTIDL